MIAKRKYSWTKGATPAHERILARIESVMASVNAMLAARGVAP